MTYTNKMLTHVITIVFLFLTRARYPKSKSDAEIIRFSENIVFDIVKIPSKEFGNQRNLIIISIIKIIIIIMIYSCYVNMTVVMLYPILNFILSNSNP